MIRFDHVSKHYPGHRGALSDITVEIADGEFVYLIGPSGAGKTTMLRLIMRDIVPTSGTLLVDEWKIASIPANQIHHLRRRVRTVYQDFKLLADRTVYENVAVGLEVLGKAEGEIAKDVMKILSLVNLEDKYRQFPLQLSAGEILDILEEVNSIGTTVIMATHNAGIVNERKKRTLTLDDGTIHSDEVKGRYHVSKKKT